MERDELEERIESVGKTLVKRLKPCPFCGRRVGVNVFGEWGIEIICNECDLSMDVYSFDEPEDALEPAIEQWNRRVHG